jgi:nucleotide-binding universal stress UspA family protein
MTWPGSGGSSLPSTQVRVVVGVDGSPGAEKALRWAADEASLRHAELEVVSCWSAPPAVTPAAVMMSSEVSELLETSARRAADHGARIARLRGHQITAHPVVMRGSPGASLVESSKGAELLVVGRRGRSVVTEVLLGSTSAYCLHHAHCPVVVVSTSGGQDQGRASDMVAASRA